MRGYIDAIGKRSFDIAVAALGLLFLSPFLFLVAFLIRRDDAGQAFYRGVRVGRHGKLFRIYKFRTMVMNADKLGASSTSDSDTRITRIGNVLRKYKLDELPQLINVLKGEMSFVGPRPQVVWAVELYNEDQKKLLTVRPGITDYASVKFRNEGKILKGSKDPDRDYLERIAPEKLRLGLEYVENMSLRTDLRIIFATVKTLFHSEEHLEGKWKA
jgi:lipopolysaccharide/colanic/teichoic acid biosynthesis glycosyltransferase